MAKTYAKEKDVKAAVKQLLNEHKWFWWMPPANGFGKVGVSDINALRGGVFIAIETKFGGNKPTPHQRAFLESVSAEGAFGFVVDETRIDTLATWLTLFDRSVAAAQRKEKIAPEDGAAMLEAIRLMTVELAS